MTDMGMTGAVIEETTDAVVAIEEVVETGEVGDRRH
jgi:molybdopterin biosynthesis enzyme